MFKFLISFFLIVGIGAMSYWSYRLIGQELALKRDLMKVSAKNQLLEKKNKNLTAETEYLKDPGNLEKQLRSRLNYAKPGEKVIVVMP